jgi:M6 family metalloprotease-like protein
MKTKFFFLSICFSFFTLAQLDYKELTKYDISPLPKMGNLNTVSILIKFQGESEFSSNRSVYDNMYNSITSQSLKSYYREVSYNKLDITTYIYPECAPTINLSYVFPRTRGYFQPYSGSNTIGYVDTRQGRLREHEILDSAVKSVLSQIPSSLNLDFNNDGFVDNVMFIFKGNTGAWGDVGLWPHSGVLDSYDSRINGKRVYHYSIQLESSANFGVFCHETFHVFGAPDLYRYFTSGTPVGSWDIMASGSAHMGAFMKYKYTNKTWINNIPLIDKSGIYTLNPLTSDTNNCYRINSPYTEDEFFVLEYRRKTGMFENGLPGSGLLVYRVNTKAGDGNGGGPPDELYIFRKGGTPTVGGTISQAHLSSEVSRTAINDYNTDPKSFLSNGQIAGLDIRNIGSAGNTISFNVIIVDCKITNPLNNSIYKKGNLIEIIATAKDSANITRVDFYIDSILVGTDLTYPYTYQWNTASEFLGTHIVKAKATSNSGVYKEDRIIVNISDGSPVVQFINLVDSTKIGYADTLRINVNALTPIGKINSVKFYLDGILKETKINPPYNFLWSTSTSTYGKHSIKITAIDSAGNEGSSQLSVFVIKYLLKEGFDNVWPPANWYVNSTVYGWYQSNKGMFLGTGCAATRNYHAMGVAILETPTIRVEQNTTLEFYWMDRSLDITAPLVTGHDTTYCEISVNGGNYTLLKFLSANDVESSYHKELFNLSQYSGSDIKIRWRDVGDESLETQGTALDEVKIISIPPPNGILEESNSVLPSRFSLKQNYPNPFNPTSTISLEIPYKLFVHLKVYNILGKEVATLVNQEKQPGYYSVEFNANNLPSGIYFYQLKAGNFNQVRKMILLK